MFPHLKENINSKNNVLNNLMLFYLLLLLAKLLFFIKCMLIFQSMGVTEMASILTQQSLGNECNDNEPMLQPHPDQTDTIDGEFFFPVQLPLTEL